MTTRLTDEQIDLFAWCVANTGMVRLSDQRETIEALIDEVRACRAGGRPMVSPDGGPPFTMADARCVNPYHAQHGCAGRERECYSLRAPALAEGSDARDRDPSPGASPDAADGELRGLKVNVAKCAEIRTNGGCVGVACPDCPANAAPLPGDAPADLATRLSAHLAASPFRRIPGVTEHAAAVDAGWDAAAETAVGFVRSLASPVSAAEATLREALQAAEAALVRAREALNHDRTGLATALCRIREELRGRYWMRHEKDGGEAGSWGSYPYPEHTVRTLRKEISWAFGAIGTFAEKALNASGNLAGVEIRAMEEPIGLVRSALSCARPASSATTSDPLTRSDWKCCAGTAACPGTQGSLKKDWICDACGRRAHAPKTWRDKGLPSKPVTYEPSGGSDAKETKP